MFIARKLRNFVFAIGNKDDETVAGRRTRLARGGNSRLEVAIDTDDEIDFLFFDCRYAHRESEHRDSSKPDFSHNILVALITILC